MSIFSSIALLGGIGCVGAVALNRIAKRFFVAEDPKVAETEALLPGANCGGCGCKGCHDFAAQCVKAKTLDGLYCPSAGQQGMKRIADLLGLAPVESAPKVAVLKCAGTYETKTPLDAVYRGPRNCTIMNMGAGDYACLDSCLGCGDCVASCKWDSLKMGQNGLPVVDSDTCVGCGACVKACPRALFELRPKGLKGRRVWVACSNCQKGGVTRKQCTVGCIACGLCVKTCPFGAIAIVNNHAYINPELCKTCGKCIPVCPTQAIHYANMKIVAPISQKDMKP